MACLAIGKDGQIYNVNADQAAVACAACWHADALIFLTDVDGVRDGDGKILPQLAGEEIPALIRSGVATGGMLAKLNAVEEALAAGIPQIVIRNGRGEQSQHLIEQGTASSGTVIVSALAAAKKN
jgi:acetylglutamate kinase